MVAPTGFEAVCESRPRFRQFDPIVARQQSRNKGTRLKHAAEKFLETSASWRNHIADPQSPKSIRFTFQAYVISPRPAGRRFLSIASLASPSAATTGNATLDPPGMTCAPCT